MVNCTAIIASINPIAIQTAITASSMAVCLVGAGLNSGMAISQSTFNDPVPLSGNAAQNEAGTATINSAIGNSGKPSKRSPAEQLRRQADDYWCRCPDLQTDRPRPADSVDDGIQTDDRAYRKFFFTIGEN